MVEFMDEQELIAEFHRAGIFLDGEKEALQRQNLFYGQLAIRNLAEGWGLNRQPVEQRRTNTGIGAVVAGSLGGALGGLFR